MGDSEYSEKSGQIRQLAALPPDKLIDHLSQTHSGMEAIAPNITPHIHSAAANAIQFLNSKLPYAGNEMIQDKTLPPSEGQRRTWLDLHKVVNNPLSVLDHVNNQTLSKHHIEALQSVYPDLHQEMIERVQEHLGAMKNKGQTLPYGKRVAISKFIGAPLDSTMTLQNTQAIIASAGRNTTPQTGPQNQKRPSGPELSQINKVNSLDQTKDQARQSHRKSLGS